MTNIKDLLRKIHLNKYESIAYDTILRNGVVEASVISKKGGIPFGKIYESLGSLSAMGLIDVQETRPKKYKIKNPKTAFQKILNKRTQKLKEETDFLKQNLIQIEDEIGKVGVLENKEKTFWSTAIGGDIEKMIGSIFDDAKRELCIIPYIINKSGQTKNAILNIPKLAREIEKCAERGVKIKAIFPAEFARKHMAILKKMKIIKIITKNIEIKTMVKMPAEPFIIIDRDKTILRVNDPIDEEKILAMIKITDVKLSENLRIGFDKMWGNALKT